MPNKSTRHRSRARNYSEDRSQDSKPAGRVTDEHDRAGDSNSRTFAPHASRPFILAGCLLIGFLAYLFLFLLQPSQDPRLTSPEGDAGSRFLELFVMQYLLPTFLNAGEGQEFGLLDRLPILLGATVWLGIAWWIGRPLVERLLAEESPALRLATSILVGLAWLSTTMFCLGTFRFMDSRWPLLLTIVGMMVIAYRVNRRPLSKQSPEARPENTATTKSLSPLARSVGDRWLLRWTQVCVWGLAAVYVVGGMMPPVEFDVVEYHLQAPKEFYQDGEIWMLSHNVYATMPLGVEMHSLAAMTLISGEDAWWIGGLTGKLVTSLFAIIAAVFLFGFLERRTGRQSAWIAAGLFLAAAGNLHVSLSGLIDVALGAYVLSSFVVTAILLSPGQVREVGWKGYALIGTLAGAAAACKYPGLLIAVAPVTAILVLVHFVTQAERRRKSEQPKGLSEPIVALVVGLTIGFATTCLPWFVRNLIFAANPIHPLADSIFDTVGMSSEHLENWRRVHSPQPAGTASAFSLTALWESLSQVMWKSPMINPALTFLGVLGSALSLFTLRHSRSHSNFVQRVIDWPTICTLGSIWTITAWWFLTHRIDRFWLPVLPMAAVLAGYAIMWLTCFTNDRQARNDLEPRTTNPVATALLGIAALGTCYGFLQGLTGLAQVDNRYFVSLESLRAEAGLSPSIAWINDNLDPDQDRILLLGEAKMYHLKPDAEYATCFNVNHIAEMLQGEPPRLQSRTLDIFGITHVLVNWSEIDRYRAPGNYGFSDFPQRGDLASMAESNVIEPVPTPFDPNAIALYRVRPAPLDEDPSP